MPSKTIHFAILGAGMIAGYYRQAIAANDERGARLAAVGHYCSQRYAAISQRFGVPCRSFDEILVDPAVDAVCIATPSGQHAAQAMAAAHAGKRMLYFRLVKALALTHLQHRAEEIDPEHLDDFWAMPGQREL